MVARLSRVTRSFTKRTLHGLDQILFVDRQDRLVNVGKRIFQIVDNFRFVFERCGAGFLAHVDGNFLAQNRGAKNIVHGGNVLHLFAESAHAFEFAVGGRKPEFIFRHRLGGRNEFVFHVRDGVVQYLRDRAVFLFLVLRRTERRQRQHADCNCSKLLIHKNSSVSSLVTILFQALA